MREVNSEFPPHYLVPVKVTDRGSGGFWILVLSESEAFGAASFAVVDEAEGDYAANRLEDLGNLLFR